MQLEKLFHKGLLRRKDGRGRDQHDHDLPALKAAPYQYVAQKAAAAALVEDQDLEIAQHVPDIHDDAVGGLILDEAVVHRHDTVAARLVDAGDDVFFLIQGKGRADLVAVVGGINHADNGLHVPELAQQGDLPPLFAPQLFGIREMLQLAAAALFIQRAEGRVTLFHGCSPSNHSFVIEYFIILFRDCNIN